MKIPLTLTRGISALALAALLTLLGGCQTAAPANHPGPHPAPSDSKDGPARPRPHPHPPRHRHPGPHPGDAVDNKDAPSPRAEPLMANPGPHQ